ncbi:MAG: hypothetical protein K2I69_07010 [Muribaculaceae bacterium]|nr:hypothetical protein [Muribaculaceae bacterium]MDE6574151.1 hypothetical protein [Muribaculaceae bacterium]
MRHLSIIAILLASICFSCGNTRSEANDAELEEAAATGRSMALDALKHPAGSMKREDAVLAIRAKETELRFAGFNACADTFAASAQKILLDSIK